MNYCPYCGEQVCDGFAFCPKCGQRLSLAEDGRRGIESAEEERKNAKAAAEEKELAQIEEYKKLYDSIKNKCAVCGGQPDADCAQMIHLTGKERENGEYRIMEVMVPVCKECDLAWKRKRAIVDQEVAAVDREIEVAMIVYEKKKKMMDFICFGYDRVLRKAYEPVSELKHKKALIEKEYPSLDCLDDFPLIVILRKRGYIFGTCSNPNVRGRGLGYLTPKIVVKFK